MERLIYRREISLIGSTSFGFAQNMVHDFQILIVALSSTNATKTTIALKCTFKRVTKVILYYSKWQVTQ